MKSTIDHRIAGVAGSAAVPGLRSLKRVRTPALPGFTIVELLVVITVITVLLALLSPALESAIRSAAKARCAAQESQIAVALQFYLNDSRRYYPSVLDWGGLLGKKGTDRPTDRTGQPTTENPDVTGRPLNAYLGYMADGAEAPIAHCPGDTGDLVMGAAAALPTAYDAHGSSYQVATCKEVFRVAQVFQDQQSYCEPQRYPSGRDLGIAANGPIASKLVLADFVWHGNRSMKDQTNQWHSGPGRREFNALFADSHVAFIDFDDHPLGSLTPADWNADPLYGGGAPYW